MNRFSRLGSALLAAVATGAAALAVPAAAQAQSQESYPNRPIRVIIGFAAGGGTDAVLRLIATKSSELLGQQVIVDNRPGANGNIAGQAVAKAAPDGYTLLYNTSSIVLSRYLYANLSYDFTRELAPVALTASIPLVLVSHPSLPVSNVAELVSHLKANQGRFNYASASIGNITHLAMVLLLQAVGAEANTVPYKAEAPAIADVLGGQVKLYFGTANALIPLVQQKRLNGLAVSGVKRMDAIRDVPTLGETVRPGMEIGAWSGVMAPAGTPQPIVARLNTVLNRALQDPDLRSRIVSSGAEVRGSTVEEYGAYLKSELERWGPVIRAAGLKPE